jgi:A/G-specific adenine glycosylase
MAVSASRSDQSALPPLDRLQPAVLTWYAARARALPFRGTTDPYAILVSETMAQQTQAARAGEAWTRFMDRFPTVQTLAGAPIAGVLREWQGLGYNRRALNLWRAAGRIVSEFDGRVPSDLVALESLPGVGPYTARAVAAIAFGSPVGAVDTNVRRVLGRMLVGEVGILTPAELQRRADSLVPVTQPGRWTHALMDLGAAVCKPRRPDCASCPVASWCAYVTPTPGHAPIARRTAAARPAKPPFHTTSRWLRGRIIDRLREAPDRGWVALDPPFGGHNENALATAVWALARDGLLEVEEGAPRGQSIRARLPIG